MKNKYFIRIPKIQENWLKQHFEKINNFLLYGCGKTFYEYDRFFENICGNNKRLFDCDFEVSFIESICYDYLNEREQKYCIDFFLERIDSFAKEAGHYEYFEVANNLKFIESLIKKQFEILKNEI